MPTSSGKLQLQDYDAALIARGFDGYPQDDRYQMINLAYRYLARKFPWSWESTSQKYTINPGGTNVHLANAADIGADNIDRVVLLTDPYRRQLKPITEDRFFRDYWTLDLSAAQNRDISNYYMVFGGDLYFLKPPSVTLQFQVFFHKFIPDMVAVTDTPATPQILDEVLLNAALVRAHERAHELTLAQEAQSKVDEAIGDMLAEDVWTMPELQERVLPDDQWL